MPGALAGIAAATMIAISFLSDHRRNRVEGERYEAAHFLPSLAFPNAGNLGLPLAFFAAGDEGLNYAIVIFAITSIFNLTIGQALAAGRGNWTAVLKSPIIPAVALGLASPTATFPSRYGRPTRSP